MSYWDAYCLPVPVRKYWIKRYNKKMQEQSSNSSESTERPMTSAERMKYIRDAQKVSNSPQTDFMNPLRNMKK